MMHITFATARAQHFPLFYTFLNVKIYPYSDSAYEVNWTTKCVVLAYSNWAIHSSIFLDNVGNFLQWLKEASEEEDEDNGDE